MAKVAYDSSPIPTAYRFEMIKPNRLARLNISVAKIIMSKPNDKGCRQLNGKIVLNNNPHQI